MVLFRGPSKEYAWGKWLLLHTNFLEIGISGNGQVVVGQIGASVLYFFRALDGGFINAQNYQAASNQKIYSKTLALSSDNVPVVYQAN